MVPMKADDEWGSKPDLDHVGTDLEPELTKW